MVVGKFTGNLWALRRLPDYVHAVMSVINSTSYCDSPISMALKEFVSVLITHA